MSPEDSYAVKESKDEGETSMPFMDTFYSLASNDPSERNFAASSLIQHVFSSDSIRNDVTINDGTYAFTRLLMGICSGRASARQGMASCLASFLKIAFQAGPDDGSGRKWIVVFMEHMDAKEKERPIEFIRKKLVEATCLEAPKGKTVIKKTRSDERDVQFGRLFGILAVVRSGILNESSVTLDDYRIYVSDLIRLYFHKKWLRESAVHAMNEFFTSISTSGNTQLLHALVESSLSTFFQDSLWTSEKIAIYLFLQTLLKDNLPTCISDPLLTTANLMSSKEGINLSVILRDTSTTVHPRIHIVWKAIWTYTCEYNNSNAGSNIFLIPRENLPVGSESALNILSALIQNVIIQQLLGDNTDGGVNATHERRALALSLVHQLLKIKLPNTMIEKSVLHQIIVTKLFIHTLQKVTGNRGSDKTVSAFHTLQPLARFIIERITEFATSQELDDQNRERRLCISMSLLKANPSFDIVTNTQTVSHLIGLDSDTVSDELIKLWDEYSHTLMVETIHSFTHGDLSIMEANRYIDILYSFAKRIQRFIDADRISIKVMTYFLLGAFFDLSDYNCSDMHNEECEISAIADLIKDIVPMFPYETRIAMSSRFFSLLSERCSIAATDKGDHIKEKKNAAINMNVEYAFKIIRVMKENGATLSNESKDNNDDSSISQAMFIYNDIQKKVKSFDEIHLESNRGLSSFLALASSLCIQVLHPGEPDEKEDDTMEEEDDVTDDVLDLLSDIYEVMNGIFKTNIDVKDVDEDENGSKSDRNILVSLATICVSLLNSSLGGSFLNPSVIRGGASKLVRDTVSLTWNSTLNLASIDSCESISLDSDVVNVLLSGICSENVLSQGKEEIDDEEMEESIDDSEDDSDQEDISLSFSKLAASALEDESGDENDDNSSDTEPRLAGGEANDSLQNNQNEEALDPLSLEKLLIEDSDDDDNDRNILEHHEGADAALAQLIKMKQDARKKAQEKREKSELANRLRCLSLLEAVYSSAKRTSLLSNQAVLMPILPLLRSRTELLKSINAYTIEKKTNSIAEKRSLMEKITNLIENKICKVHLEGTANVEACNILADQVMVEMKRAQNIDHSKCCSAILVLVNKAVSKLGKEAVMLAKGIYEGAVLEWSTKKNTRLQSVMFEDFINKVHHMAHIILPDPLISASKSARSSYLQAEAFRLLGILYQKPSSSYEPEELDSLQSAVPSFIENISTVLKDETMVKAKRVREVVKSAERLVSFINNFGNTTMFHHVVRLGDSIKDFENGSSNNTLVKKLRDDIEKLIEKLRQDLVLLAEEEEGVNDDDEDGVGDSKKTKKKSNKKKSKKNKK